MDNYFRGFPPMMSDGRQFTDYRSPQVREKLFKYKHGLTTENEIRTFSINNGEQIINNEWNYINQSNYVNRNHIHKAPTTKVHATFNNTETLIYNKDKPNSKININMDGDFRLTQTCNPKQILPKIQHIQYKKAIYRPYAVQNIY